MSFPPAPGTTKETYRDRFTQLAEARISGTVYLARKDAIKKLQRPGPEAPITPEEYLSLRRFPAQWCTPARLVCSKKNKLIL